MACQGLERASKTSPSATFPAQLATLSIVKRGSSISRLIATRNPDGWWSPRLQSTCTRPFGFAMSQPTNKPVSFLTSPFTLPHKPETFSNRPVNLHISNQETGVWRPSPDVSQTEGWLCHLCICLARVGNYAVEPRRARDPRDRYASAGDFHR